MAQNRMKRDLRGLAFVVWRSSAWLGRFGSNDTGHFLDPVRQRENGVQADGFQWRAADERLRVICPFCVDVAFSLGLVVNDRSDIDVVGDGVVHGGGDFGIDPDDGVPSTVGAQELVASEIGWGRAGDAGGLLAGE